MSLIERGATAIVLAIIAGSFVALWVSTLRALVQGRFNELDLGSAVVFLFPFALGLCWLVGWLLA